MVQATPPKRKLEHKLGGLDFEIARQPGSNGNMRLYREDGSGFPVTDINTLLLWEILKALHKD
jgi:hypothetical protein